MNNTVYFRWFESVRMELFRQIGWLGGDDAPGDGPAGVGPILARTSCVFKRPVGFPDTIELGTGVTEVGEDRFTMLYRAVSRSDGVVVAEGDGRIVSFDYGLGVKASLPAVVRDGLVGLTV